MGSKTVQKYIKHAVIDRNCYTWDVTRTEEYTGRCQIHNSEKRKPSPKPKKV